MPRDRELELERSLWKSDATKDVYPQLHGILTNIQAQPYLIDAYVRHELSLDLRICLQIPKVLIGIQARRCSIYSYVRHELSLNLRIFSGYIIKY